MKLIKTENDDTDKLLESIKSMPKENKIILLLTLSEKALRKLSNVGHQIIANKALDYCWEWLQHKKTTGDFLYNLLDNKEENGITVTHENTNVESDILIWNCIIYSVAYTSRKAYENEGAIYFPEPIALVDDDLIDHFITCFNQCFQNNKNYITNLQLYLSNYKFSSKNLSKNEILNKI